MKIHFFHHSFHGLTGSSQFMIRILQDLGHAVHVYSREGFEESKSNGRPDLYVLWQSDMLLSLLENSKVPIVCIPMLDDALPLTVSHFRSVRNVKYISFSRTLHHFLKLSGCDSSHIKFWPILEHPKREKTNSLFFWERNPSHLNHIDILQNLKDADMRILVRQKPDPHDPFTEGQKQKNERVEYLPDSWLSKNDYLNIVAQSKVFIAPRPWEGIGLSFLEAMIMGCCVVAFNNPTMSEYIVSGKTGILIKNRRVAIDLSYAEEIGKRASEVALEGSTHFQIKAPSFFFTAIETAMNGPIRTRSFVLPSHLTLRKYIFFTKLR